MNTAASENYQEPGEKEFTRERESRGVMTNVVHRKHNRTTANKFGDILRQTNQ
jgi:hypothetical protein